MCENTGLEVVVDDGWANLVEVLEGIDNLHYNRAALLLGHQLILLQVEVQIIAFTVLQHCAEPARGEATDHLGSSVLTTADSGDNSLLFHHYERPPLSYCHSIAVVIKMLVIVAFKSLPAF